MLVALDHPEYLIVSLLLGLQAAVEVSLHLPQQQQFGEDVLSFPQIRVVPGNVGHFSDLIAREARCPDLQALQKLDTELRFILQRSIDVREYVPACRNAGVSRYLCDLLEDLANEGGVVDDYDCVDVALPHVVAQLQQVRPFVREVVRHVRQHRHAHVYGGNGD